MTPPNEDWDLPLQPASGPLLESLCKRYLATGRRREYAISLGRLSALAREVELPTWSSQPGRTHELALQAIPILRELGEQRELVRALRAAAVPFVAANRKELLSEALEIAKSIGDREQEGWALFDLSRNVVDSTHVVDDALACFNEI